MKIRNKSGIFEYKCGVPDLVYCHIYLYIFVQDRYYGICICMYYSACEQCKLHDACSEAGATQIALQFVMLELEGYAGFGKTCAHEGNNGSRVKFEDGGNEYGNEFN